MNGRELMGEHLLDAVLGLDGVGRIEGEFKRPGLMSEIEPGSTGVSRDVIGIGDRVTQGWSIEAKRFRGDELAPGSDLDRPGRNCRARLALELSGKSRACGTAPLF